MHTCVGLDAQHGIMHDAWNWSVSAAEGGSRFSNEIIYVITTTLSRSLLTIYLVLYKAGQVLQ